MSMQPGNETTLGGSAGREFLPTAWTQVLTARDADTTEARPAWDQLVGIYWKPVYFHIRRKGHSVEDAKDLTQSFFVFLMEREALRSVSPDKGRFRAFVRACLDNFLLDEVDKAKAEKRRKLIQIPAMTSDEGVGTDFERDWALAILERAFASLRKEAPREARILEAQRNNEKSFLQLAQELNTSEANIKSLAHRGRKRLKTLVLRELRATVDVPGDEKKELSDLFRAFSL